jgi:tetratricopeptide (TPR) repeat protein
MIISYIGIYADIGSEKVIEEQKKQIEQLNEDISERSREYQDEKDINTMLIERENSILNTTQLAIDHINSIITILAITVGTIAAAGTGGTYLVQNSKYNSLKEQINNSMVEYKSSKEQYEISKKENDTINIALIATIKEFGEAKHDLEKLHMEIHETKLEFSYFSREIESMKEASANLQEDTNRMQVNYCSITEEIGLIRDEVAKFAGKAKASENSAKVSEYISLALKTNDYDEQIKLLSDAIKLDENNKHAYNNRGHAYFQLNKYEEAKDDFSKAIKIDSKNALAYTNRGSVNARLKKFDEAMKDYKYVLDLNPNDAFLNLNIGICYLELGDYDKAIENIDKAIAIDSTKAQFYNTRAIGYNKSQKYKEALEDYNKAIDLEPNDPGFYNNRANNYRLLNEFSLALSDIKKSLELDSKMGITYATYAETLAMLGDEEGFYENIEKALAYKLPVKEYLEDEAYRKYISEPRFIELLRKYTD